MKVYTFKAEEDLMAVFDALAEANGMTRSEAIRKAIGLMIRHLCGYDMTIKWRVKRVVLK